jgi:hypothetical protein
MQKNKKKDTTVCFILFWFYPISGFVPASLFASTSASTGVVVYALSVPLCLPDK